MLNRFIQRAIELGLRTRRSEKAEEFLRLVPMWLDTFIVTPGNRRIAQAFLTHKNYAAAATASGVSRQRVEQVMKIMRRDLQMAERVDQFPDEARRRKEDPLFDKVSDGAVWKLTDGVDFEGGRENFIGRFRQKCVLRQFKFKSMRDQSDAKVVYVQLSPLPARTRTGQQAETVQ